MLKYFIAVVTSVAYFLSISYTADAEVKIQECNTIKAENNGSNRLINCNPSKAEIKIIYRVLKEAYAAQNKGGDGTDIIKLKKLNLQRANNSEYHYLSFYEVKNVKIVDSSMLSSSGTKMVKIEASEIERVYKRTQTYGKSGESYFHYELVTQVAGKGLALLSSDSNTQAWRINGGLGHAEF
jgi:hypothetical protein